MNKVEIVKVNAIKAQTMLDSMFDRQRPISESNVKELMREMTLGKFGLSNDAIVKTDDGVFLNGQHRLTAVTRTGTECEFIVLTVPKSDDGIVYFIDCGKPRTVGDALAIGSGAANSKTIASAIKIILAYKRGLLTTLGNYASSNRTDQAKFVSRHEVIEFYGRNKKLLQEGYQEARRFYEKTRMVNPSQATALWFLVVEKYNSAKMATSFTESVYTGEGEKSQIVAPFRNALTKNLKSTRKYPAGLILASLFNCFNFWRTDTQLGRPIVSVESKFPKI